MKSIILLCLLPICLSHRLCDRSHYWSNDKESCLPCLKCPSHQVTVKPCQAHQNTICKSVSKFDLPWKKDHHKATIHFETDNVDDYDDDIYKDIFSKHLDASGKPLKHERNFDLKQRPNDKFLSWDDDKKTQKHKKHYEFSGSKHHQKFDIFDDENENKDSKYRGNNHKKNVHRVKLEDEDILKQWLIQSKKQFKIKKDKMLKNLKEEKDEDDSHDDWDDDVDDDDWDDDVDDDDWDDDVDNDDYDPHDDGDDWDDVIIDDDPKKKIKLNYPLHKNDKKMENSHRSSPKRKEAKQLSDIDEKLFKDLIKNEDTGDLDVSTLLSNKRDPFAYKATISLGKPSTIKEIIGQVKDPEELIKEELGRNVIYEKSKISVLPIQKEFNDADVISVPFTAAERFVWDWQALALCSALFACLVFFIVVISYTIINARQWKRVKRNYSTELEEMSTKIALMQPTLEAVISENPTKIESQKH